MSESTAEAAEATGGIQPGQMYAANEDGELELIDENGKAINDGDQDNSSGDFMDTLNTILDIKDNVSDFLDIKDSVSDFFKKDTPDVSLSEEAGSIAEDTRNTRPRGTSAFSKFTQKMNDIKTKAMNKITPITESISNAASKTKGKVKGMSDKALIYLKNLLTAGIDKVKALMPGLSKKLPASMVQKLSNEFIASLAKNGSKYMTKIAAQIGVAMTGVGAIAVAVLNLVNAFDNIYNEGWKRWYNNADALYNEDIGDDVKYVSVLAGAISTLLFSVIPVKWVFKTLASILGLDLSQAQARAQEAVDDYNADKESHPKGAPDTVADVEEYNAMYEKGLLESVKDTGETLISFGKDTLTKMNQAAKNIYKYVGDKATAAKNWAKNNAKWLAENGMNWFKQAYQSVASTASNLKDRAVSFVKNKYESAKQTLGEVKDEASARASNVADTWNNNSGATAVVEAAKAATTDSKEYKKDKDDKQSTDSSSNDSAKSDDSSTTTTPKGQGKHGLFGRGYYKQTQYSNIGFNVPGDTIRQTIGDSGCGPVAAVNAIQALGRGTSASDPVIQASNFALQNGFKGKDTGTDPRFFGSYAASQGIGSKDTNKSDVKSELSKGNSVVIEGEDPKGESSKNPFAEYPHYVTATGYNAKNGTVTIQDPESNKDNSQYKLSEVLNKTNSAITFFKPAKQTTRKDVPKWYGMKTMGEGKRRFGRGGEDSNDIYIWNKLTTEYGFSNQAAAAIMGSMQQESSFNPTASQLGGGIEASIAQGEGTNGYGLCQWTGSRTQELVNFCNANGMDPSSIDGQIAFMVDEMGKRGSLDAFASAGDLSAALSVMKDYEGYGEAGSRDEYAAEIFANQGHSTANGSNIKGGKTSGNKAQAPQNSYGIFDAIMKPFDQLNSSLGQVMGGITSDGPFKQMSDISTKIFGSMIGGAAPAAAPTQKGAKTTGGQSGYGVQGGLRGSGFDDKYIEVNGPEEQTALIPVQDIVKEKFNGMAKAYFEKTGDKLMITGGAEGGGVHADGTYSHSAGWKLDVAKPLSDPDYFVQLGRDYNVAVGNEDDAHYDLGFGADNVGGDNLSDCHPNAGQGKHGLGKHGPLALRFGRGGKSSDTDMRSMGKSISSANKRYGKGILSDVVKSAFKSDAFKSSIKDIFNKITGKSKNKSNDAGTEASTNTQTATTVSNTDLSQDSVIELLKISVQLLTTIANNTGNMGSMSKEAVEQQQASISSAINSIGQMMAANNQSMMNGVSQMISSNNGMSYEQQHMSLSLDQLASL